MTVVATDRAPAAVGPYAQAIVVDGRVYTSGQIALDPATGVMSDGDVVAQTERVFDNLEAVLESAGSGLASVIKTTVFIQDMNDFARINEVYARRIGDHRPARSTVEVAKLPLGALVEIEAIALVDG